MGEDVPSSFPPSREDGCGGAYKAFGHGCGGSLGTARSEQKPRLEREVKDAIATLAYTEYNILYVLCQCKERIASCHARGYVALARAAEKEMGELQQLLEKVRHTRSLLHTERLDEAVRMLRLLGLEEHARRIEKLLMRIKFDTRGGG